MALEYFTGFDFVDQTELNKIWMPYNGGITVNSTTAFSYGRSVSCNAGFNGGWKNKGIDGLLWTPSLQRVWGMRVRLSAIPNSHVFFLCSTIDTAGSMINVAFVGSGAIRISRNGNPFAGGTPVDLGADSVNQLVPNTWYFIEICVEHHPTAGTVEVFVDGSKAGWIDLTGVNTSNGLSTGSHSLMLLGSGVTVLVDDMYLLRDTKTRLGDCRTLTSIAQADSVGGIGNYIDSTPVPGTDRGANVDDPYGAPDRDITYNRFILAGQKDSYKHTVLAVPGAVLGVNVHGLVIKSDAGDASARIGLRKGSVNMFGPEAFPAAGTYNYIGKMWEKSPFFDPAVPWTVDEIDSTQLLIERVI